MKTTLRRALIGLLAAAGCFAIAVAVIFLSACNASRTISFETDGGTVIDSITAKKGSEITPPEDPEKVGFEFDGWYLDAECTGEEQTLPTVMPNDNVTYYAKWTALPKITLDLAGGSLPSGVTELYLKAGEDLYQFMRGYQPSRSGYQFGNWFSGTSELSGYTVMPESGVTLTARWKVPYTVQVTRYDLETNDYVRDGSLDATQYAYSGDIVSGDNFTLEKYTVNPDLSGTLTVTEGNSASNVLTVFVYPAFTAYSDVFGGSDILYNFEIEENVLYLDRQGWGELKAASAYSAANGTFAFDGEGDYKLNGRLGESEGRAYFYYYTDTVENKYTQFNGTATLDIKAYNNVVYTDTNGTESTGSYSVNVDTGRFVFTPASGESFEFVFVAEGDDLYFRTYDNLSGLYAYTVNNQVVFYLSLDGYGSMLMVETAEEDDENSTNYINYEVAPLGENVIVIPDLGYYAKITKGATAIGGVNVDGTVAFSTDGYGGYWQAKDGDEDAVMFINGFGEVKIGDKTGTYQLVSSPASETWYVNGTSGQIPYPYVNETIKVTVDDTITEYVLYGDTINGEATYLYAQYNEADLTVKPGRYNVSSFTLDGAEYKADNTSASGSVGFLYFYNYDQFLVDTDNKIVDLWYGTYEQDSGLLYTTAYIYFSGTYAVDGNTVTVTSTTKNAEGKNPVLVFTLDQTAKTATFVKEENGSDFHATLHSEDGVGELFLDLAGHVYFKKADGTTSIVEYTSAGYGVITGFSFERQTLTDLGFGATAPITYLVYIDENNEPHVFDSADTDTVKKYYFYFTAYDENYEEVESDYELIIVEVNGKKVGMLGAKIYEDVGYDYVVAGNITEIDGLPDEYNFVKVDGVDYPDQSLSGLSDFLAMYSRFQFKIEDDEFFFYDGHVFTATRLEGNTTYTFSCDGYGNATYTEGRSTITGTYQLFDDTYDKLYVFTGAGVTRIFNVSGLGSFTEITADSAMTPNTIFASLYGYTVEGEFSYTVLILDGNRGAMLTEMDIDLEAGTYSYVTSTGTASYNSAATGYDAGYVYTVSFTAGEKAGESMEITVILTTQAADTHLVSGLYYQRFPETIGDYTVVDGAGATIGSLNGSTDGYVTRQSYMQVNGDGLDVVETGYLVRGNMVASDYNTQPTFENATDGDVVMFVTYDANGYTQNQYIFDIVDANAKKVRLRTMYYGVYREYDNGTFTDNYLELDGRGGAKYHAGSSVIEGTYGHTDKFTGSAIYTFTPETGDGFDFRVETFSTGTSVTYAFAKYVEENDETYKNGDLSLLIIDGFDQFTYVDKYGSLYTGLYADLGDGYFRMEPEGTTGVIFFKITGDKFALVESGVIVVGNTFYAYLGGAVDANGAYKIPDGVTRIAEEAFSFEAAREIKSLDLNQVTTLDDRAFYYCSAQIESLTSTLITAIPNEAFVGFTALKRVSFTAATKVGVLAFASCEQLTSVTLGAVTEIGEHAFSRTVANKTMTVDLSNVTDYASLKIDATAFQAVQDGEFVESLVLGGDSKIYVLNVETATNSGAFTFKDNAWAALTSYLATK